MNIAMIFPNETCIVGILYEIIYKGHVNLASFFYTNRPRKKHPIATDLERRYDAYYIRLEKAMSKRSQYNNTIL